MNLLNRISQLFIKLHIKYVPRETGKYRLYNNFFVLFKENVSNISKTKRNKITHVTQQIFRLQFN